jgi:hypothetical protein
MAHNTAHHRHVTLHAHRNMPAPVADNNFWGSVLNIICSVLQLDNTLDIGFVLAASSAHGHSPQTPQEDYQNPKSRCSASSVTVTSLSLHLHMIQSGGHITNSVGKLVRCAC